MNGELSGVDLQVAYLQLELLRLGQERAHDDALAVVSFGELVNCERCEQIFEALQGTLRAAKKRKKIKFQGEMLLKGVSDHVEITLLEAPPDGLEAADCVIHTGGGAASISAAGHAKGPNAWAKVQATTSVRDHASKFSSASAAGTPETQTQTVVPASAVSDATKSPEEEMPETAKTADQASRPSSSGRVKSIRDSFTAAALQDSGLPMVTSPKSDGRPKSTSSHTSRASRGSSRSPTFAASSTRPMSSKIANLRSSFAGSASSNEDRPDSPPPSSSSRARSAPPKSPKAATSRQSPKAATATQGASSFGGGGKRVADIRASFTGGGGGAPSHTKNDSMKRDNRIEKGSTRDVSPERTAATSASVASTDKDEAKSGRVAALRSSFISAEPADPDTVKEKVDASKAEAAPSSLKAWAESMGEEGIAKLSLSAVAKLGKEHFEAMEPDQLTVLLSNFESDLSESQKHALLEVIDNLEDDELDDWDEDEDYCGPDDADDAARLETERQATEAAERERIAQVEAERKRQAQAEAERRREAELEADRKRKAELEEKKRQAELEAKRKQQAELEAEKKREAERAAEAEAARLRAEAKKEAEFKRASEKAEAQKRRAAELEAERKRAAKVEAEKKLVAEKAERARAKAEAEAKAAEREAEQKRAAKAEAEKARAAEEAERARVMADARAKELEAERQRAAEVEAERALSAQEAERVRASAEAKAAELEAERQREAKVKAENARAAKEAEIARTKSETEESHVVEDAQKQQKVSTSPVKVSAPATSEVKPPPAPVVLNLSAGSGGEYSNKPQTFIADVENLDSEVANKKKTKLAAESNEFRNALVWILKVTKEEDYDIANIPYDDVHLKFGEILQDGVLLCKLLNQISPGSVPTPKPTKIAFKQLSNISSFCRGCQKLGLQKRECFDAQDLQKFDNLRAVLDTLHALNRCAKSSVSGFAGPYISAV